jgi:hypothetical protein
MVANCILAHKIAIAAFHMLKEGVPFDDGKLFGSQDLPWPVARQ